ncbi:MAG: hypothetical protein U0797_03570 [Gemmataceae bacterium]
MRRFNFLQFSDYDTPSLKLMYNPDVTVRTRGVMEKCTFCIQRVSHARIEASKQALEGRRDDPHGRTVQGGKKLPYIPDEEIYTACEAACPAEAITFGDLNDRAKKLGNVHHPGSEVARLRESPLSYDLLGELGTRPRVFYLAAQPQPRAGGEITKRKPLPGGEGRRDPRAGPLVRHDHRQDQPHRPVGPHAQAVVGRLRRQLRADDAAVRHHRAR